MDSTRFDALARAAAAPAGRRTALRLLAAGLVGGLFPARLAGAAQGRPDTDGDGLYDDDELGVYGTDPYNWNTDGDGSGDGAEVYYGTAPLVPDTWVVGHDGLVPPNAASAENTVAADQGCLSPNCVPGQPAIDDFGAAAQAGNGGVAPCRGIGVICDYDAQCCNTGPVLCCWDGVSLQTECTDVTPYGGTCPD